MNFDRIIKDAILKHDRAFWSDRIDAMIVAQGVEPDGDDNYRLVGSCWQPGHGQTYPACVRELVREVESYYLEPIEAASNFGRHVASELDGNGLFRGPVHELIEERLMEKWDAEHAEHATKTEGANAAGDAR